MSIVTPGIEAVRSLLHQMEAYRVPRFDAANLEKVGAYKCRLADGTTQELFLMDVYSDANFAGSGEEAVRVLILSPSERGKVDYCKGEDEATVAVVRDIEADGLRLLRFDTAVDGEAFFRHTNITVRCRSLT